MYSTKQKKNMDNYVYGDTIFVGCKSTGTGPGRKESKF